MLFLNGIPFFFMELAIGQWFSAGVIGVWKSVCPLMKGKRDSRSYKKRRPRAVVILSSEPRAAGEKVKLCKLEAKNEERLSGEKFFLISDCTLVPRGFAVRPSRVFAIYRDSKRKVRDSSES